MAVVGLDLSLTATGIAWGDDPHLAVVRPKEKGMARISFIRAKVLEVVADADLVLIEGYSFGSHSSHSHALGELGGVIRHTLWSLNIPYVDVPPATLKMFLVGKGNANKDDMVATAARLGCLVNDNNAVDAWALWHLGMYQLIEPLLPTTAYRTKAMGTLPWPHAQAPAEAAS